MKKRFCLMLCILIGICAFLGCSGNDAGLKKVELHEVTRSVFYAILRRKACRSTSPLPAAATKP